MLVTAWHLCYDTAKYYLGFCLFYILSAPIDCNFARLLFDGQQDSAVHLFVLSKQLQLWHSPHYRAPTFADDLRDNLRNVCIPGTGLPLSVFCRNRLTALLFILVLNPLASLVAACYLVLGHWVSRRTTNDVSGQGRQQRCDSIAVAYRELLLSPQHWFAIWRHNCLVVGYHALVTGSSSYRLEDKGVFLLQGDRLGLPVSPFYKDAGVFVKHKSIEGGMGINVFRNFAHGGDWIIQKALSNSPALAQLLPHDAPLSTLRVVTASTAWLQTQNVMPGVMQTLRHQVLDQHNHLDAAGNSCRSVSCTAVATKEQPGWQLKQRPATPPLPVSNGVLSQRLLHLEGRAGQFVGAVSGLREQGLADPALQQTAASPLQGTDWYKSDRLAKAGGPRKQQQQQQQQQQQWQVYGQETPELQNCAYAEGVQVVTAVWRAGLAGADTDHSCVCFNINTESGVLGPGVTANHWYKLGLGGLGSVTQADLKPHLMHPQTGKQVAGVALPEMPDVVAAVVQAHLVAAPDVPLIGWDVALTPDGVYILEANISCNLFNGHFNRLCYYELLHLHLAALHHQQQRMRG